MRDYIHVLDLAHAHALAVKKLATAPGLVTYNLGTGNGYSVLDIVKAFEKASGRAAKKEMGFECAYGLKDMCEDSWRWQSNNPDGYGD